MTALAGTDRTREAPLAFVPANGDPPLRVEFDASGLCGPEVAGGVHYTFDFGDGSTVMQTEPSVGHVYETAGTYPVLMILTDREGRSVSAAAVIEVRMRRSENTTSDATARSDPLRFGFRVLRPAVPVGHPRLLQVQSPCR